MQIEYDDRLHGTVDSADIECTIVKGPGEQEQCNDEGSDIGHIYSTVILKKINI